MRNASDISRTVVPLYRRTLPIDSDRVRVAGRVFRGAGFRHGRNAFRHSLTARAR